MNPTLYTRARVSILLRLVDSIITMHVVLPGKTIEIQCDYGLYITTFI